MLYISIQQRDISLISDLTTTRTLKFDAVLNVRQLSFVSSLGQYVGGAVFPGVERVEWIRALIQTNDNY